MLAIVHTYGHIDSMYYVLSAIAALTKNETIMPLVQAMCLISVIYYAIQMAYYGNSSQNKQYILKTFGMFAIINIAIIPKTSMIIRDHVTKHQEKVDNLPYGFAVPVAILEHFGDVLTSGFEQAFQVVGARSTNYSDYGMVFGARLIQESRNWRIKNPEFIENMDNFIRRCVIREAMIGKNYTPRDLLSTDDIWSKVKRHASRLRQVPFRTDKSRELISCAKATRKIELSFTGEIADLSAKYQKSDFTFAGGAVSIARPKSAEAAASASSSSSSSSLAESEAKDEAAAQVPQSAGAGSRLMGLLGNLSPQSGSRLNQTFSTNIKNAFQNQIGGVKSAESIIKQQMMINAMHNFSDDYGFARASSAQESSWRLSGDLSTIYLPMLLTVMKGIFYASFIFLIPMMLLSGGIHKYLGYLSVIASLQLWPALNSILNMFIDFYSSHNLSDISGSVVSFSTSSRIGDYTDKIVAVASGLQMVVPFLAFGIIQGGVSGFMNIAGTITGATQSAATSAAHEVTTGNRSLDNISTGNLQKAMQSAFKTDLNSSYASSASSYQHLDGIIEKTLPDGETIYASGAGLTTSTGATNVETRTIAGSQTSDTLSHLASKAKSSQVAYTNSEVATMNKSLNSLVSLSKHDEAGTAITTDKNSNEAKLAQHAQSYMRHLRDTFGYTHEQAAAAYLKASLDLELAKGGSSGSTADSLASSVKSNMSSLLSPIQPKAAAGIGVGGSFTASNNDTQNLTDETGSAVDNSHIVTYSILESALSSEHYANNSAKDQSLADDLRRSRDSTNQLARTAEMRSEDLQSYGSNITNSDSTEVIITHENRDEVIRLISESENIHALTAQRALDTGDAIANNVLKAKANTAKYQTEGTLQRAQQSFEGDEREKEMNVFEEENLQKVNAADINNANEVMQRSEKHGVTESTTNKAIEEVKARVNTKSGDINKKADDEIKTTGAAVESEKKAHAAQVKKAEGKRWFAGWIGRENDHN